MRNYIILFFLGSIFLSACGSNSVPAGIIPKKQMTDLLTQIHLADGNLYNIPQSPDTLYKHGMSQYLALFKLYHTDTLQFKKSMIYYTGNTEKFDAIYDEVMLNLNAKLDSLNKIKRLRAKADSIKNVAKFKATQDSLKRANEAKTKGLSNK